MENFSWLLMIAAYFIHSSEPMPYQVVEKFVAPEELELPDGMEIVSSRLFYRPLPHPRKDLRMHQQLCEGFVLA